VRNAQGLLGLDESGLSGLEWQFPRSADAGLELQPHNLDAACVEGRLDAMAY
jgi:hypothetical protein